jgi:restriction endonuclease Mrr
MDPPAFSCGDPFGVSSRVDFIKKMHKNIVLVDGQGVGALMLRCGLGVTVKRTYESFSIDEDFFADEE